MTTIKVQLRQYSMYCCNTQVSWLGEKNLNFCPNCGLSVTPDVDSPFRIGNIPVAHYAPLMDCEAIVVLGA